MSQKCVWVLEVGILHPTEDRIAKWEIWEAFTTKSGAFAVRGKPSTNWRVVKYVPAPEEVKEKP
jgi:hypothetical protein